MNIIDFTSAPGHLPNPAIQERKCSYESSLYNRIKEIIKKILQFFLPTPQFSREGCVIVREAATETPIKKRDFLQSIGEPDIHLAIFKRNEVKTVISFCEGELKTIKQYLKDCLKEFESTYERDHPNLDRNEARRLGRACFETQLLDCPQSKIAKKANAVGMFTEKIDSLNIELEAYNIRLHNYGRRLTYIKMAKGLDLPNTAIDSVARNAVSA